jgi:hypothetical protein
VNFLRQLPLVFLFAIACSPSARAVQYIPPPRPVHHTNTTTARWHSIEVRRSPTAPPIRTRDKFNPLWWFSNVDEPHPPPSYLPNKKFRTAKWRLRNSFHNFTYYVIGIADKPFVRSGRHPDKVFNPEGHWNFAICKYRFLRLPFLSYHTRRVGAYIGWRDRGNFGLKFNVRTGHKPAPAKRSTPPKPAG